MNVLILNDDGLRARGLAILQETAKATFPEARTTTLCLAQRQMWQGTCISAHFPRPVEQREPPKETYVYEGKPADLVMIGFYHRSLFLPVGETWDLVLCGIDHGHATGQDVLHSGTTCQAMLATSVFGCAAIAFNKHLGHCDPSRVYQNPDEAFKLAAQQTAEALRIIRSDYDCWNVNLPAATIPYKGPKWTTTGHYSDWRQPPVELIPRAKDEDTDTTNLKKGHMTITPLVLRVNVPIRF